jgi:ribulose-phosphate 3-epimerase
MKYDLKSFDPAKILVSPSLLAADFSKLGEQVAEAEAAGCKLLHLDIMDGHFVPNLTFGPAVVKALRKDSGMLFDVHFMLSDPIKYVKPFADAGADLITFHIESNGNPAETIAEIRKHDCRVGLTLKPGTPAEAVFPWLDQVDMILVMTVNPGFGGQSIIYGTLDKVKALRKYIDEHELSIDIQVDGGINEKNVGLAASAGANIIVAGSAIFKAPRPKVAIANLRELAEQNPYIAN